MKSKILIGSAPLSSYSLMGIYVIGGSQSLRRGRTAYHLGSTIWYYYISGEFCQYLFVSLDTEVEDYRRQLEEEKKVGGESEVSQDVIS
jgi:hypothetical protein